MSQRYQADGAASRPAVHALVIRVAVLSGVFLAVVGAVLAVVGANQEGGSVLLIAGLVALGLGLIEALVGITLLLVLRQARRAPRPPGML